MRKFSRGEPTWKDCSPQMTGGDMKEATGIPASLNPRLQRGNAACWCFSCPHTSPGLSIHNTLASPQCAGQWEVTGRGWAERQWGKRNARGRGLGGPGLGNGASAMAGTKYYIQAFLLLTFLFFIFCHQLINCCMENCQPFGDLSFGDRELNHLIKYVNICAITSAKMSYTVPVLPLRD